MCCGRRHWLAVCQGFLEAVEFSEKARVHAIILVGKI